jgi:GNAT superfamily N-acetyltransferase
MWGKLVADVGVTVSDEAGVAIRWADSPFVFYNALVATDPVEEEEQLRSLLARSSEFMRTREQPGCLWLFDELVSSNVSGRLEALAHEVGLVSAFTCWGMAGDLIDRDEPHHPLLRFERVASAQHLEDYARLNARAYALSEEAAITAFAGSRLWREEVFAYVAYEGSSPVACAGACKVDGRLFLVLVATEAAHRRRGFGEAITRKALIEASRATGIKRVCLQATADGKPIYEKIGLRVNSSLQLFMPNPS